MLTSSFEKALVYAYRVHAGQKRKGSGIPYISHLLAVAALVLEAGGSETEAIGALLHDAVEDQDCRRDFNAGKGGGVFGWFGWDRRAYGCRRWLCGQ